MSKDLDIYVRKLFSEKQEQFADTSNELIARRLDVSYGTVRNYRENPETIPLKVLRKFTEAYNLTESEIVGMIR